MSEETNSINPADLQLPRDYEDDLDYRLPKPVINSTDTSDNEDKSRSGETTPKNDTHNQPTHPNTFALLDKVIRMDTQGTGANSQQLGPQANPLAVTSNMYDIADQLANLRLDPQNVNYLAPDDVVKKYKELEVQYHKDKINNGKIICTILDYIKTFKDPRKRSTNFSRKSKRIRSKSPSCAIRRSLASRKQKKFPNFTRNQ
jgi:hypothetical protein